MATKKFNFRAYIVSILRRASYRNPQRTVVLTEARSARNTYHCKKCEGTFTRKEVKVDHIEPVVPITGFTTWDSFIERLFCGALGLQLLCSSCHKAKTKEENRLRAIHKKRPMMMQVGHLYRNKHMIDVDMFILSQGILTEDGQTYVVMWWNRAGYWHDKVDTAFIKKKQEEDWEKISG